MTEDPRAEAERLMSEWDRWAERKPYLVDVLAATIEEQDAESERRSAWDDEDADWESLQRVDRRYRSARRVRRESLSALRALE